MYWNLLLKNTVVTVFQITASVVTTVCSCNQLNRCNLNSFSHSGQPYHILGTIGSKINVTPKNIYLPTSKLHSSSAVANLLAHNNKSQICYCGQISLQSAAVNCSFSNNLTPLGVTFILLEMVQAMWKNYFASNLLMISSKIIISYGIASLL